MEHNWRVLIVTDMKNNNAIQKVTNKWGWNVVWSKSVPDLLSVYLCGFKILLGQRLLVKKSHQQNCFLKVAQQCSVTKTRINNLHHKMSL